MNEAGGTSGEFTVVQRRKGGSRGQKAAPSASRFLTGDFLTDCPVDQTVALRRLKAAKEELKQSDYFKTFILTLKEALEGLKKQKILEILCFGLGHIVHDPIFYSDECEMLKSLGLTVIRENEEGKRKLRTGGISVIYFPHCPKQLTNNFIWKNWGKNITNCVLIGNSLTALVESQPTRLLHSTVPHILNIYSYTQEFTLVNSFKYFEVFNDTSIHIFPENILMMLTDDFWKHPGEEPAYKDEEIELISSKIVARVKTK